MNNFVRSHKDNSHSNFYYLDEHGNIGYSDLGDGIHIAEIKFNLRYPHFTQEVVDLLNLIYSDPTLKELIATKLESK